MGQEATILIRPTLLVNGRKTSVKFLKSIKVNLECQTQTAEEKVSREYGDLTFSDDEETLITFQVPADMTGLHITIDAKIQNVTLKKR